MTNDVAALDGFFLPTEDAIRYGSGENLHRYDAIGPFRAARSPSGLPHGRRIVAAHIRVTDEPSS